MVEHRGPHPIHIGNHPAGYHSRRVALAVRQAVLEGNNVITIAGRQVQIVNGNEHQAVRTRRIIPHHFEQRNLVAKVQSTRRLIQEKNTRATNQSLSHGDQLSLTTRELRQVLVRQVIDAQPAHGLHGGFHHIVAREKRLRTSSRNNDRFKSRQRGTRRQILWNITDGTSLDLITINLDGDISHLAHDRFNQRGFTTTIGPQEPHHIGFGRRLKFQVHAVDNDMLAIGDVEVVDLKLYCH